MSADVESAFKSTTSAVPEAWEAMQVARQEWADRVRAYGAQFGFTDFHYRRGGGSDRFAGFATPDDAPDDWKPSIPGWRYAKTSDVWVPDRRYKAGQNAEKWRRDHGVVKAFAAVPGMSAEYIGGGHWYTPGAFLHDGTVYVHWGVDADTIRGLKSYDPELWTEIRLSEYHAAREAYEDAETARKAAAE